MYLLFTALIFTSIVSTLFVAIRLLRLESKNIVYQLAIGGALSTAGLAFLEFQTLQIQEESTMEILGQAYSFVASIALFFGISSVFKFLEPFKGTRWEELGKYTYVLAFLPIVFFAYMFMVQHVNLSDQFIYKNGVWFYSLGNVSLTSIIYFAYFFLGVAVMVYTFWWKYRTLPDGRSMLDKKIVLALMTIVPMLGMFYFLFYARTAQVPYLGSLPIGICVMTLSWTFSDFNLFQVNSRMAHQMILNTMSNLMLITDHEFRIVETNLEVQKILDSSEKELSGTELQDVIKSFNVSGWKKIARNIQKDKSLKHTGQCHLLVDGEEKHFSLSISPILNQRQTITGYLMLGLDVTEEKQRELEIIEQSRKLKKSNLELERFAYIASHDLKTPLRNVVSFLDLIERRIVKYDDKELKDFTQIARKGASQMYHLIQDILEFSRLNVAKKEMSDVDLNETMMNICLNLRTRFKEKDANIMVSEMPVIKAEKNHMLQLFTNLVDNGIKYNDHPDPKVTVNHRIDNDRHVFAISDNGIGIDEKYYTQIFQLFNRLHTNTDYEGSGIGLSICKKILDYYKGEIWCESKPNEGTTFFFTLSLN
ncbi:MAG: PAS domain S-box protein [Saprospiraceae bacterium]|nr:PAS domain S-box protein [Saprospiraceae bacterium]